MKKILFYLLFVISLSAGFVNCSGDNNESKIRNNIVAGLYEYTGPGPYYIFLYPDGKGIRYKSSARTEFTWSLDELSNAEVNVVAPSDNEININNVAYKKVMDYDASRIDQAIVGKWEINKVKTIYPVVYDDLLDEVSFKEDATIKEIEITSIAAAALSSDVEYIYIEFTRENVMICTYVASHGDWNVGMDINDLKYNLGYLLIGYKVSNNKISYIDGVRLFDYKFENSKLEINRQITNNGKYLSLRLWEYHKLNN